MLIGIHVSAAGGLTKALERAESMGCEAMQIFSQSPRSWRPAAHTDDELADFRARAAESTVQAVMIHAVYLINCASLDEEIYAKSTAALTHALHIGDDIGALGVVVHPGSARAGAVDQAMARIRDAAVKALTETKSCPLLFENTAGAGKTIGRSLDELADLIEGIERSDARLDSRLGLCLDSCHLFASGHDLRKPANLQALLDELDARLGMERLRCLHLNDSKTPLGSNRDRHANLGEGELGRDGIKTVLAEPRLTGLPVVLEVPGALGKGPDLEQLKLAKRLRREARKRRVARR